MIFECLAIERRVVKVQVEAADKHEAAEKSMKLFEEHGVLVLFESVEGMWVGPEDPDFDEEIEVAQALEEGPPYWAESELIELRDGKAVKR